jgi:hypothetical protein
MVMTHDRQGIFCDYCGAKNEGQFSYYSCVVDKLEVDVSRIEEGLGPYTDHDKRHLDIDFCSICMDKIKADMKQIIKDREKKRVKDKKNNSEEWSMKDGRVRPKRSKSSK